MLLKENENLQDTDYLSQFEYIQPNKFGGFVSTSAGFYNRRKYHGLFNYVDAKNRYVPYMMVSAIEEKAEAGGTEYDLSVCKFSGGVVTEGYRHLEDVSADAPEAVYRLGGARLQKEVVSVHASQQTLVRYTLLEGEEMRLTLSPLITYRSVHELSHRNDTADKRCFSIGAGYSVKLYPEMPWLNMQLNRAFTFEEKGEWYLNFVYDTERERGYDHTEDLLRVGSFRVALKRGESVVLSFSTEVDNRDALETKFNKAKNRRRLKGGPVEALKQAASSFIAMHGSRTVVIAGYPWFGPWGRDTFISLPGLTLSTGSPATCENVLKSMIRRMNNGLFVNMGSAYNSCDAPLWFFWTLQQLEPHVGREAIFKRYFKVMADILYAYRDTKNIGIGMKENHLIYASVSGKALTWMDAIVNGIPVTGRDGYQVEINALWYNAVCYAVSLAKEFREKEFYKEWHRLPLHIKDSFNELFWNEEDEDLFDFVQANGPDFDLRPNQIIACSLPFSPLTKKRQARVFRIVESELLTPRGLRTLSADNPKYRGRCEGTQAERDMAYHNGSVWVWQLEHFVRTGFDLFGKKYLKKAQAIFDGFADDLSTAGLGSISEIFDGTAPHTDRGAVSQAWSVGALLRINDMINSYK